MVVLCIIYNFAVLIAGHLTVEKPAPVFIVVSSLPMVIELALQSVEFLNLHIFVEFALFARDWAFKVKNWNFEFSVIVSSLPSVIELALQSVEFLNLHIFAELAEFAQDWAFMVKNRGSGSELVPAFIVVSSLPTVIELALQSVEFLNLHIFAELAEFASDSAFTVIYWTVKLWLDMLVGFLSTNHSVAYCPNKVSFFEPAGKKLASSVLNS